jgi:hypothetical protein
METTDQRRVPLIVVAGREGTAALVECLRAQGAVVYQTHTPEGCLRVATAVGPDMIVLPPGFPRRLAHLLQQHPRSAGAKIVCFQRAVTGDAVVVAAEGVAVLAHLANGNGSLDSASDPGRHPAARQVNGEELGLLAGQLAGECLERPGPAPA